MPRSLKVRPEYIPTVKSSLLRNGFPSQKILAEDLGIAKSTVSNFLNGKPVDYPNFLEICRVLAQEWRNIADLSDKLPQHEDSEVKAKILISHYSPDNSLAMQLQQTLSAAGHQIFLLADGAFNEISHGNRKLLLTSPPTPLLQGEVLTSPPTPLLQGEGSQTPPFPRREGGLGGLGHDYLLLLLSQSTATSEMVLEAVHLAKELQSKNPQKPAILPICLDLPWECALPFDLFQLLEGIQPWQWRCSDRTSALTSELLTIIREGRISLPPDHELAVSWTSITPEAVQEAINSSPLTPPPAPLPCHPMPSAPPELPEGQVELASRFYIERPPIEARCYETIVQPGALIRIKAPRQMGKTSLMARILHHAENQGSKTVALNFQLANKRVFANSDTFLQWFCASVGLALGQLDSLSKSWELAEIIGSNLCCKAYFEKCLLLEKLPPLTLGLDEVDRVFEFPEIADDFLGLLRALHEESKQCDIWKKFRLIVVHSTEVYIPLDLNKSPFNVGLPIELPELNAQQVQELAKRHRLDWQADLLEQLMALVGGHPYLVRLAMYHIACQDVTLDRLVKEAATEAGIYIDHLRRHLWNLDKYPAIKSAFGQVVTASGGVRLPSEQAFKLNSMGLVKLNGNDCTPRCKLYQDYFCDRLDKPHT